MEMKISGIRHPLGFFFVVLWLAMLLPAEKLWAPYQHRRAIDDPLGRQKAQIYDVYGDYVIRGAKVHQKSLRLMLTTGIKKLSGMDDPAQAWRCFIHDEEVVALNFTTVNGKSLSTNTDLAGALLDCLYQAGFKPENFMIVGLAELPPQAQGTRPWRYGWQEQPTDIGTTEVHLARWLEEVTAIINIPSIMDDHIVGLRGAMVNMTLPLLKSPALLYLNGGDPFLPEIYDLPAIKGKIRLHLANMLLVLYYGGPVIQPLYVYEYGSVLFGTDPVALDWVASKLLTKFRTEQNIPLHVEAGLDSPYLDTAFAMGLGYQGHHYIEYQRCKHESLEAPPQ